MFRITGYTIHNGHIHGYQAIEPPIIAFSLKETIDFGESLAWEHIVDTVLKKGNKRGLKDPVSCHLTYIDSDSILRQYEEKVREWMKS